MLGSFPLHACTLGGVRRTVGRSNGPPDGRGRYEPATHSGRSTRPGGCDARRGPTVGRVSRRGSTLGRVSRRGPTVGRVSRRNRRAAAEAHPRSDQCRTRGSRSRQFQGRDAGHQHPRRRGKGLGCPEGGSQAGCRAPPVVFRGALRSGRSKLFPGQGLVDRDPVRQVIPGPCGRRAACLEQHPARAGLQRTGGDPRAGLSGAGRAVRLRAQRRARQGLDEGPPDHPRADHRRPVHPACRDLPRLRLRVEPQRPPAGVEARAPECPGPLAARPHLRGVG